MVRPRKDYCEFDPVHPKLGSIRAVVVDNLLRDVSDLSPTAEQEPDYDPEAWIKEERYIAGLAVGNIAQNVRRLVRHAYVQILHLSEFTESALRRAAPDAIILSGTLRDFDLYHPDLLTNFRHVLPRLRVPILGICGGHQLIGWSYGVPVLTLDRRDPRAQRTHRLREYEYGFVQVTDATDPIFHGLDQRRRPWFKLVKNRTHPYLRVWQNHALMLPHLPPGFVSLAKGHRCANQMMVLRSEHQLIYTVQFHIEKSFEDWNKLPSRWEHPNESRDGRLIFENFLAEALKHRGRL